MTMPNEALLLSRKDAAKALSISTRSIDLLLKDGRLIGVPMGTRILIHRLEIQRLASEGITGRIRIE